MTKNDAERNFDKETFDRNFELIFGKKEKENGNEDDNTKTGTNKENNG